MHILWLSLTLLLALLFFLEGGKSILSFTLSCLILFLFSFFVPNHIIQLALFITFNLLIYISLKCLLPKHFGIVPCLKEHMLIGKSAIVLQTIPASQLESGLVKIDGEVWPAISKHHTAISKGTTVHIHAKQGLRLIVTHNKKEISK